MKKSKISKIQILKKGMALILASMFMLTPIANATTSLDDGTYLESSWWEQLLYGTVGSTVNEIEEYFKDNTTLYIKTETHLRGFAQYVNNGNNCSGKKIVLLNDITISPGEEWIPIGKNNVEFKGTFNGNGFTIEGLTNSLFEYTNSAKIENVVLNNVNIDSVATVGAVVAIASNSTISECKVTGVVSGITNVGGIVGYADKTIITYCTNEAEIIGKECVGGIAGYISNSTKISNSKNKGYVHGSTDKDVLNIGGITGFSTKSTITISLNEGIVKGCEYYNSGVYIGGILGNGIDASITQCINDNEKITGEKYIGGIVGEIKTETSSSSIQYCVNYYSMHATDTNISNEDNKLLIGGIAGNVADTNVVLKNNIYTFMWGPEELGNIDGNQVEIINTLLEKYDDKVIDKTEEDELNHIDNYTYYGEYLNYVAQLIFNVSRGKTGRYYSTELSYVTFVAGLGESSKVNVDYTSENEINEKLPQLICIQNPISAGQVDKYQILDVYYQKESKLWEFEYGPTTVMTDGDDGYYNSNEIQMTTDSDGKIIFDNNTVGMHEEIKTGNNYITFTETTPETVVNFEIMSGSKKISSDYSFKKNETITIKAKFNKVLYAKVTSGILKITKDNAPSLTIKIGSSNKNLTIGTVTLGANYTTITYTYTFTDSDSGQLESLTTKINGICYALPNDQLPTTMAANHTISGSKTLDISYRKISVDTISPALTTSAYLENKLETGRYTAGKEVLIEIKTTEEIKDITTPSIQVSFSVSGTGKYNYNGSKSGYAKCVDAKIDLYGNTVWTYLYQIQEGDEGQLKYTIYDVSDIQDLAGNVVNKVNDNNRGEQENITITDNNIYSDTTAPTVIISAKKVEENSKTDVVNNVTNANTLEYTFKWSEEVVGFTTEDITVNNGNKGTFKTVTEGLEYTLEVQPTIANGNQGELQVIVEEGVCADLVAKGNIRQENIITIDKIKPTFEYGSIKQDENGKVIIEAVFSENISGIEDLELDITVGGKTAVNTDEVKEEIIDNKVIYTYTPDAADGGKVEVLLNGTVKDLPGNNSDILNEKLDSEIILIQTVINDKVTEGVYYTFEKNEEGTIKDFANRTYFVSENKITVVKYNETYPNGKSYTYTINNAGDLKHKTHMKLNESNNTVTFHDSLVSGSIDITEANIWFDTVAPKVVTEIEGENPKTNGVYTEGEELIIKSTTSEAIQEGYTAPEISVKFGGNDGKFNDGKAQSVETITNEDGTTTWVYRYVVTEGDEGAVALSYTAGSVTDLAGNSTTLTSLNSKADIFELNGITVDATAPTVEISVKDVNNNVTNKNTLEYTFKWSEEVNGFTADDITINNGEKGTLTQSASDKKVYTMNVKTYVEAGNTGDIQAIVEQDACQDKVGLSNVRTESVIRVDKVAPIFISLEAYGESNIRVNSSVDTVKQYYKAGDTVKIVATFSENIENSTVPTLNLQFSESGNAKGSISAGTKSGNKITYTYTITNGDEGTLSVKGFVGTVKDAAGNETAVAKKVLDGNTIIADTDAPSLNELKVVSPSAGTYKAGTPITIEAIYDENIYALKDNENEIKNITSTLAPILKLKFGDNGTVRTVQNGVYGTTDGETDKTKIVYTYTIQTGDNGVLKITSYQNKENVKVCDIAANEATLGLNQTGNEITADTTRPTVKNIQAVVENPTISGTGIYHKEGNTIKITLTFSEKVSSAVILPAIQVGFSENEEEPTTYTTHSYESDWNVNSETIEYSYTIEEGDNGYLWVKVPEGQFADIAGNTNTSKDTQKLSNIYADTIRPTITLLEDTNVGQTNQTIRVDAIFSENVYDLDGDNRITLTTGNAPRLIYSFGLGTGNNEEIGASSISGNTITYTISKDPVADNGTFIYELVKGNLYDRAGNEYYEETTDTTAPVLRRVYVTTNSEYGVYCKKDTNMYVTLVFNENIAKQSMKLKIKLGEGQEKEISGTIKDDNKKEVVFTYTVEANDNRELAIVDVIGSTSNETAGYVEDSLGNRLVIDNLNGITVDGKAIADTTAPTLTITSDKEITNQDIVTYTFTWNETVSGFNKDDIEVINASKGDFKQVDETGKVYTLTVDATSEGRQIIRVNSNSCIDVAGNANTQRVTYNNVIIDFTKPAIRAQINGGNYMLDAENTTVVLKEKIVVNEELSKLEYAWSTSEATPEDGWVTEDVNGILVNSDIEISKETNEAGRYYLHIKATDIAGNTLTTRTKAFIVAVDTSAPVITFSYTLTTTTLGNSIGATILTNEDATISYSWDNQNWTTSEEYIRSVNAVSAPTEVGTYTLYAKAEDKSENESTVQKLEFTIVESPEEIEEAEIIFEDLPVVQIDGVKYVKIPENMTSEVLTSKMNKQALLGKTPEFTKLTDDNDLRTGSEITLDGELRYIVVVKGDINCDGNVTFKDIIRTNAVRIASSESTLSKAQLLAADLNNSGKIEFRDIISINAIRINSVK